MRLRLATRGSALALRQAEHASILLRTANPDLDIEITVVRSSGDRDTVTPASRIGVTGVFTREVDREVLEGNADLAVHSLKDLPVERQPGLRLAAIPVREDARDAFVPAPRTGRRLEDLAPGALIGTGSLRRRALVRDRRTDLRFAELRGNVDSRLAKVAAGTVDGAILALAGLRRLGREDVIGEILEPPRWLPAPGQGALAIIVREDDERTAACVARVDHAPTRTAVTAERTLLFHLRGGCQVPIGALATLRGERIMIDSFVATLDGDERRRAFIEGPVAHATRLAGDLADAMLRDGADRIIDAVRAGGGA